MKTGSSLVLGLTLAAYAALAFGYISLTPIWQNPDEPAHYNYVAYVARTGGLPELQAGDWDSALLERLKTGQLQPGDAVGSIRYESWQPPLFYILAAPVFRLFPTDAASNAATLDPAPAVLRLRTFDAVLGGLTLVVAYLGAREVLPSGQALAVPLAMAGIPMFTSVSSAISADPLANLLSAATLLVLLPRTERVTARLPWVLGTGVLVGLGILTKLALAIFVPLALLVVLMRSARPLRDTALLLLATALTLAPWLVHQVATYGWTDPLATSRHAAVVLDQPRFPGFSSEYLSEFALTTFHSFWAQFGWMALIAPARLYWTYALVVLIGAAGLVRERRGLRHDACLQLVLATFGAALLAYVGYNLAFEQFQGRYLFTALVPVALLLVAGWAAWLPHPTRSWGVLLVALALVGLNAYALMRVLVPGFAPRG